MEDTLTTEEIPQDRETLYNTRVVLKQFNDKVYSNNNLKWPPKYTVK
jgi:hypothetical protein